jgi:hypothetical protein
LQIDRKSGFLGVFCIGAPQERSKTFRVGADSTGRDTRNPAISAQERFVMALLNFVLYGFYTLPWWGYVLLLLVTGGLGGLLLFLRKQNEDD